MFAQVAGRAGRAVRLQVGQAGHENPAGLAYVLPRRDCLVLGGTHEPGATSLEPDPAIEAGILERCAALGPVAHSAIIDHVLVADGHAPRQLVDGLLRVAREQAGKRLVLMANSDWLVKVCQ